MNKFLSFDWMGLRPKDGEGQLLAASVPHQHGGLPVSQPASEAVNTSSVGRMELSAPSPTGQAPNHHTSIDAGRQLLRGVERVGLGLRDMAVLYWLDIFHTMLTMPTGRFLGIFFCVYFAEYMCFAVLYLTVRSCIVGAHTFTLALWFSVRTATTIGYTDLLQPNLECTGINLLITFQVISAALIDYCMMGLVFARFATPTARASSVKFSSTCALHQQENGTWALSFRLANVRKHSLLRPETTFLLVSPDSQGTSSLQFEEMHILDHKSHMANLRLGVPTLITHVITPDSPLFDLSIDIMQQRGLEMLVFLDAIDPMTSNNIAARHSYAPHDLRMNRRFGTLDMRDRSGNTLLNFGEFDNTVPAAMYPDFNLDIDALALRTIRSLTPRALGSPSMSLGGGGGSGGGAMPSGANGTNTSNGGGSLSGAMSGMDWQTSNPTTASSTLLDRERQLSALCEAVMRDGNASAELRHLAASASFGGPHASRQQQQNQLFQQQHQQHQPPSQGQQHLSHQQLSYQQQAQLQQQASAGRISSVSSGNTPPASLHQHLSHQQLSYQQQGGSGSMSRPQPPTSIMDADHGPEDMMGGSRAEGPRWRSSGAAGL